MEEFFRVKTTRTRERQPQPQRTPRRDDKRKAWKRTDKRQRFE